MDRPLSAAHRRHRVLGRALPLLLGGALFAGALVVVPGWMRPSVQRSHIRTAVVDRGPIQATLSATGVVVPRTEQVLTSPVSTRVKRLLKTPGDSVVPGESVVELDLEDATLDLQRLDDQIALKENARDQARLDLTRRLGDLRSEQEVQALEVRSSEYEVSRNSTMVTDGLVSRDALRASEIQLERARIELARIETAMVTEREALDARFVGLDLEIEILQKDRAEAQRRLEQASATSDRPGVVTWVIPQEGAAVAPGEEIARLADLSAFRVEATISDMHAGSMGRGMPVRVLIGDRSIRGTVSGVRPTVENGILTFDIELDKPDDTALRHNLRVDVHVITSAKDDAVCLARGSYVTVDGVPAMFVIRGDRAVRTPIRFGLNSFETYEILEGLVPGEEVILTDMSQHAGAREVQIQ